VKRAASSFVVPALLLSTAAAVAAVPPAAGSLSPSVHLAPVFVFGGGSTLALIGRRSRLVVGLAAIALADRAMIHLGGRVVFDVVSFLLPLNLGVLAWLREAHPLKTLGVFRIGLVAVQAGIVAFLYGTEPSALTAALEQRLFTADLAPWTALPQLSLVAFAVALSLALVRSVGQRRGLAAGALWALVASFIALDGAVSGQPASIHFMTAALLLIIGVASEPRLIVYRDDVTGLPTRLELNKALARLPRRYALACVEVDEFRRFSENYGPDATHRMLRAVADALAQVGGRGRVFCCDTSSFVVVFRRTPAKAAVAHLDVVRDAIPDILLDIRVRKPRTSGRGSPTAPDTEATVAVTISAGVAQADRRDADPRDVLSAAEAALNRAKREGHRVSL
jgi:GGDEF domain-containing protein